MRKLIAVLSVVSAAVFFASCNKFLDEMPDNRTQIDNLDKVKALLVTAYPGKFYATWLEPRCDGMADHGATLDGTQPSSNFAFIYTSYRWDEYPSMENSDDAEAYWTSCYGAIAAANHALEALDKLGNPKGSEPYRAEALLCRAYAHFCLLTLFTDFFDEANRGTNPGIPYVTEPEDVVNKQYDRETVSATLAKVKDDLSEGLKGVGTSADFEQPKFHFTLDAARMLALRVALFERDYPTVISYASQLIPQPTTWASIVNQQQEPLLNADGSEVKIPHPNDFASLFCVSNLFDWRSAMSMYSGSTELQLAFSNANNANVILAAEPYSLLNRTAMSTAYTRYTHGGKEFNAILGANASGVNWHMPTYGFNGAPADAPGFLPKIYEDFKVSSINADTGQPYARIALFRLEEALLARAEAYAMTGEYDKALADLTMFSQQRVQSTNVAEYYYSRDKVVDYYTDVLTLSDHYMNSDFNAGRFSADLSTYEGKLQRGLVLAVLDARRMEYIYEGMRWFDILRWNIPVTHTMLSGESSTLTPDDDRRVIQIPETASLSGLEKNPYDHIPQPWS